MGWYWFGYLESNIIMQNFYGYYGRSFRRNYRRDGNLTEFRVGNEKVKY